MIMIKGTEHSKEKCLPNIEEQVTTFTEMKNK